MILDIVDIGDLLSDKKTSSTRNVGCQLVFKQYERHHLNQRLHLSPSNARACAARTFSWQEPAQQQNRSCSAPTPNRAHNNLYKLTLSSHKHQDIYLAINILYVQRWRMEYDHHTEKKWKFRPLASSGAPSIHTKQSQEIHLKINQDMNELTTNQSKYTVAKASDRSSLLITRSGSSVLVRS